MGLFDAQIERPGFILRHKGWAILGGIGLAILIVVATGPFGLCRRKLQLWIQAARVRRNASAIWIKLRDHGSSSGLRPRDHGKQFPDPAACECGIGIASMPSPRAMDRDRGQNCFRRRPRPNHEGSDIEYGTGERIDSRPWRLHHANRAGRRRVPGCRNEHRHSSDV